MTVIQIKLNPPHTLEIITDIIRKNYGILSLKSMVTEYGYGGIIGERSKEKADLKLCLPCIQDQYKGVEDSGDKY